MTDLDYLGSLAQLAAHAAVHHYGLPDTATTTLINVSENATFRVAMDDGQCWALRVHREGYHSKAAIASELAWAMDLRAHGSVATPRPVAGLDGELIQVVSHPLLDGPRHVVMFMWEAGVEPFMGQDLKTPFETLGEISARMHVHARSWQRPANFERFTWDFETCLAGQSPHWGKWQDGAGMDAGKTRLFARAVDLIGKRLAAFGQNAQRFGLVHGDMRLANLLVDGTQVKILDFDDCGFSWFMYDAATPVSFHEHEPQVSELIEAWKEGYRKVLPLTLEDEQEIPTFLMLRRLLLVAWIGSHGETDLAKSLGAPFTEGTSGLCETYLTKFS